MWGFLSSAESWPSLSLRLGIRVEDHFPGMFAS